MNCFPVPRKVVNVYECSAAKLRRHLLDSYCVLGVEKLCALPFKIPSIP